MKSEEPFSQLQLRFTDSVQYDYEGIRPVILFAEPVAQRSDEYRSLYADPQIEMFELDSEQWLKVMRRPHYVPRKKMQEPIAEQLSWLTMLILYLITRS